MQFLVVVVGDADGRLLRPARILVRLVQIIHGLRINGQPSPIAEPWIGIHIPRDIWSICKIFSQREFSVWLRKLKQGLYINMEVWKMGGRPRSEGIYVYLWLIHVEV